MRRLVHKRALQALAVLLVVATLGGCAASGPTRSADEFLELQLQLDHSVLSDDQTEAVAMLRLDASELPVGARPPVSFALVIDASGSMEGQKIEDARAAAIALIDQLTPADRLTVITFSEEAVVQVALGDGGEREEARDAIAAIEPLGNTCTSCGLTTAYEVLDESPSNMLRRVVLLSDGHANRGSTEAYQLADLARWASQDREISTATIGLGRLHNEDSMAQVASAGLASYYFLHNSSQLAEILERELRLLHETVLTELAVRFKPGDGVQITGSPNTGFYYDNYDVIFSIGSMSVSQGLELILELHLPPGDMGRLLFAEATFSDVDGNTYEIETSVAASRSNDPDEVEQSRNPEVTIRYLSLEADEAAQAALLEVQQGRHDLAVNRLTAMAELLNQNAELLDSESLAERASELIVMRDKLPIPVVNSLPQNDYEDPYYYEMYQEMPAEDSGYLLNENARSNERRRGTPNEEVYHPAPASMDFSATQ
ncbi:MAG: VWA domain-containing protein [Myxococcales bacterium]|nr:VWA domain-containing protein [Myxococcales bacterium]